MDRRLSIISLGSSPDRPISHRIHSPSPQYSPMMPNGSPSSFHRRPSQSDANPRGTKRRRISDSSTSREPSRSRRVAAAATRDSQDSDSEEPIESIDLTEVEDASSLAKALSKQREDAVKALQEQAHEKGRSVLTSYKCPVCMDTPEDATSTVCGHLFCHKCIIDTLKFSEEQRSDGSGKGPRGTCPVCRKPLTRTDAPGPKRNLVPLQLKLMTKKRSAVATDSA